MILTVDTYTDKGYGFKMALLRMSDALAQVTERSEKGLGTIGIAMKEAAKIEEGRMKDIAQMRDDGASAKEIAKKLKLPLETVKDILGEGTLVEYTDKQIKMAFGIINDPRYKGGNYSGAYKAIEKLAKGLASHPSVANALKRANEDIELENSLVEAFDLDLMEFTDDQLDRLAKSYADLKGKTISLPNANKLRKIFDKIPDSKLNALRKKKIPFISGLALSRMIQKKIPVREGQEHSAFFIAGVDTEEVREDWSDDYLKSKLNDTQIANIKKQWQTKKPTDVTPGIRKMIKGFDEPTKIAISHANINVLSKLAKEEVELKEVSPPGWEGSVRAMKDNPKIDNPYALAWSMKNKGDKPHYKDKDGTPVKKDKYKNEGAKSTFERLWHKRGDKVKR